MEASSLKKGALPLRRVTTPEAQDKKLREVAELYEKQFMREMLKSMRATVPENGLVKSSQAEKIFREQLDGEYVEKWGARGGLGLSEIIYKQLIDKYGERLGITKAAERPTGSIPLDEKSVLNIHRSDKASKVNGINKTELKFDLVAPSLGSSLGASHASSPVRNASIKAPWSGQLLGVHEISSQHYAIEIQHPEGLRSRLAFRGEPLSLTPGQDLDAGQSLGLLSPEAKSLFWEIEDRSNFEKSLDLSPDSVSE